MVRFDTIFKQENPFHFDFKQNENTFELNFNCSEQGLNCLFGAVYEVESKDVPIYEGITTVSPDVHEQKVLYTANKKMLNDVTIKKVPYFETSNDSGLTVYIGGEI